MDEETIKRGTLYFLWHPGDELFSGYGLTVEPGHKKHLVGLLMVDRPRPVDPNWLACVEAAFGDYMLYPITAGGERGIACQMWIEDGSLPYLRQVDTPLAQAIRTVLTPFLEELPKPQFELAWDEKNHLWQSAFRRSIGKGEEAMDNNRPSRKPLFSLGQVVATPGALEALEEAGQTPMEFLRRHVTGDWGNVPEEDKRENELSVQKGFRILSAYYLSTGAKIWVITEADRSVTTLLLPSEY